MWVFVYAMVTRLMPCASIGWVINRDGDGALGQAIIQAFEANSRGEGVAPKQHLTWTIVDPSQYPTDDDVGNAIVDEQAWAAVVGTFDSPFHYLHHDS